MHHINCSTLPPNFKFQTSRTEAKVTYFDFTVLCCELFDVSHMSIDRQNYNAKGVTFSNCSWTILTFSHTGPNLTSRILLKFNSKRVHRNLLDNSDIHTYRITIKERISHLPAMKKRTYQGRRRIKTRTQIITILLLNKSVLGNHHVTLHLHISLKSSINIFVHFRTTKICKSFDKQQTLKNSDSFKNVKIPPGLSGRKRTYYSSTVNCLLHVH